MTISESLQAVADWLGENVCPKVTLKRPNDADVEKFEAVHPVSYAMFYPTADKRSPNDNTEYPAVVTQLIEGTHTMTDGVARYKIQLSFSTWDPGTHPQETDGEVKLRRTADGWVGVWNFVDRALQELESVEYLNGLRVVKEQGIKFGPPLQEGQVSDLYPYWAAWVMLTVEHGLVRAPKNYRDLL